MNGSYELSNRSTRLSNSGTCKERRRTTYSCLSMTRAHSAGDKVHSKVLDRGRRAIDVPHVLVDESLRNDARNPGSEFRWWTTTRRDQRRGSRSKARDITKIIRTITSLGLRHDKYVLRRVFPLGCQEPLALEELPDRRSEEHTSELQSPFLISYA